MAVLLATASAAGVAEESAADVSTRRLLDALDERAMPDVTLAVLDRLAGDGRASEELRRDIPFRRSAALVVMSRREADADRRAAMLDEAQAALDQFLAAGATTGRQQIDAYTQKGSLLVERGRSKADQARRPGADAQALRGEAVRFFDAAIAALRGTVKPGEPIGEVRNAEDAVVKALREVNDRIAAIKRDSGEGEPEPAEPDGKPGRPKPKPKRPTGPERQKQTRALRTLAEEQQALQIRLIQTRLAVADAVFRKADVFEPRSQEWTQAIEESGALYKALADKYPTMGGGLLARCYQGRNDALLGKWKQAIEVLAPVTALEPDSPLTVSLRAKAVGTVLECLLAEKNYEGFGDDDRGFALSDVKRLRGGRLDSDWLALKYRAAVLLDARAAALDEKDSRTREERNRLQADARGLAAEVARANADFATEARSLAAKLGRTVGEGERTFASTLNQARQAIGMMQASLADAKAAAADPEKAEAARVAAARARESASEAVRDALAMAGAADPSVATPDLPATISIDEVNEARSLLAYLSYEGQDFEQAVRLGRSLAESYPNAKGSRQAARIALAACQQLSQRAPGPEADAARKQAVELATIMLRTWPDEAETADAAAVAVAAAGSAHDPATIAAILNAAAPSSPRRAEILLRGGSALWREVQHARRLTPPDRPGDERLAAWKATASRSLDEGLAAVEAAAAPPPPPLGPLMTAGAIARGQIALDDGDAAEAIGVLEHPVYGPWTLAGGPKPTLASGSLAEAALTLSLMAFIQTDDFTRAQAAMKRLEDVAGAGSEASAKLTGMYLAMGRDLQHQLENLASEAAGGSTASRDRAGRILQGFTTFLDAVADRDRKTSSQMWVATTYLALGSGTGTGAVVARADADRYLRRASEAYGRLLAKTDDPELAGFEPSIRLRLADLHRRLGAWDAAREQVTWLLADPARRNSLDVQFLAAEVLQAAGVSAAASGDTATADRLLHQAAAGDAAASLWGWAQIATRLERQGISGDDARAVAMRTRFFEARLQLVECLVARARLPDAAPDARQKRLTTADTVIAMTRKLYPDLGGEAFASRFERLRQAIGQQ